MLITLCAPAGTFANRAPLLVLFETLKIKNSKFLIGFGCLCGFILTVSVQMQYAERIVYAMARDQLLPRSFARWNSATPWNCRIVVAVLSALIALVAPFDVLLQTISIMLLISFAIVCLAVVFLRYDPCHVGLGRGNPFRKSGESFVFKFYTENILTD